MAGAATYRRGNLELAVEWLQKPASNAAIPFEGHLCRAAAYCFLAMAQHRLGKTEAALKSLQDARSIFETEFRKLDSGDLGQSWPDWLMAHIARRQAEKLVLSAESQPEPSR